MNIVKTSIKNGYSMSIGGDVSESGYSSTHDVAMVPSYDIPSEFIDEHNVNSDFQTKQLLMTT